MSDIQPVGFHSRDVMFLDSKSLKELQEIARKYGLTPVTGLKKAELIQRIKTLVDSQAQTLLDFESDSADVTTSSIPKKKRGRKPLVDKAQESGLSSDDVFPSFTEEIVHVEEGDSIFPDFDEEIKPSKKSNNQLDKDHHRYRKSKKSKTTFDPFEKAEKVITGVTTVNKVVEELKSEQSKAESTGDRKITRGRKPKNRNLDQAPSEQPKQASESQQNQQNSDSSSNQTNEAPQQEVRHADFRDATSPGGRQGSKGKKHLVHDVLPESDAPTLLERIAEIEPKLGGYLIN